MLSENDGKVATTLYAATTMVCSALLGLRGIYAERRNLVDRSPGHESLCGQLISSFTVSAVFAVSIVIARFDANLAKYSRLLLFLTSCVMKRRGQPPAPLSR